MELGRHASESSDEEDEDSSDLGTLGFGHCLSLGEKLYWRGGSGGDSVAGVGVSGVETVRIDCPFKKFGKERHD